MTYPILNATSMEDTHPALHNVYVDVKAHYAAVGDGVADDTTAIQNAITGAGGGTVYFPAGIYKVTSSLTPRSNSVWRGAGARSWDYTTGGTVIRFSGTSSAAVSLSGVSNVRMQDFQLDCTSDTSGVVGFKLNDPSSNCHFSNIVLKGPGTSNAVGIQMTGQVSASAHNTFDTLYIRNWKEGVRLSGYANANVFSNIATSVLATAIVSGAIGTDTLGGTDNLFQRFEMDGSTTTGISLTNSSARNVFIKCVTDGVSTTSLNITNTGSNHDNVFIGCNFSVTVTDNGSRNMFLACTGAGMTGNTEVIKYGDLNLYRSGTDTWATDDNFTITGNARIDAALDHNGSTVGLFGVTPAVRPSAYTVSNPNVDRTYDCDATSTAELADVLYTLLRDLTTLGIVQGVT